MSEGLFCSSRFKNSRHFDVFLPFCRHVPVSSLVSSRGHSRAGFGMLHSVRLKNSPVISLNFEKVLFSPTDVLGRGEIASPLKLVLECHGLDYLTDLLGQRNCNRNPDIPSRICV